MAARIRCRPSGVRPRRFKRFHLPARTRRGFGETETERAAHNQPERASVRVREQPKRSPHHNRRRRQPRRQRPSPQPLHMGEGAGRDGKRETSHPGASAPRLINQRTRRCRGRPCACPKRARTFLPAPVGHPQGVPLRLAAAARNHGLSVHPNALRIISRSALASGLGNNRNDPHITGRRPLPRGRSCEMSQPGASAPRLINQRTKRCRGRPCACPKRARTFVPAPVRPPTRGAPTFGSGRAQPRAVCSSERAAHNQPQRASVRVREQPKRSPHHKRTTTAARWTIVRDVLTAKR